MKHKRYVSIGGIITCETGLRIGGRKDGADSRQNPARCRMRNLVDRDLGDDHHARQQNATGLLPLTCHLAGEERLDP